MRCRVVKYRLNRHDTTGDPSGQEVEVKRAWRGPARYGRDLKLCTGVPEDFEAEHGARMARASVDSTSGEGNGTWEHPFWAGCNPAGRSAIFAPHPGCSSCRCESLALLGRTKKVKVWVVESILAGRDGTPTLPSAHSLPLPNNTSSCTRSNLNAWEIDGNAHHEGARIHDSISDSLDKS